MNAGDRSLAQVLTRARAAGELALDTEFMGERRYRTLLCLVQLAAPDDSRAPLMRAPLIAIVDPLRGGQEWSALAAVLADPAVEIVVHAGRQDIALLRRELRTEVTSVFDTQVAAGFAGMPAQASYETLLARLAGVRLHKSASFTRWDRRPLSGEQLLYAREDVLHLLELSGELKRRLRALGRLEWAYEECAPLQRASDERDPEAIFARLPRIRTLSPASQSLARELVEWRERTAARQDRPVQTVLSDAVLVEIAKRRPRSPERLHEIRGVNPGSLRSLGKEILASVDHSVGRAPEPLLERERPSPPDPSDAPLIALSEALVRARAAEADVAYELIAARADLQAIVAATRRGDPEPSVRTLQGWRRALVGEELLDLISGRLTLSVRDGALRVVR
ncbi:MAG: HRDC domain-containing protein [Solirubrobacterales bacterium]|nr:HRDC domain-containing protein [Solirubrobacterales bacterium]